MTANIYKGYNLHSYTSDMREMIPFIQKDLPISTYLTFSQALNFLNEKYANAYAHVLRNIQNHYKMGTGLLDPHLPGLECGSLLVYIVELLKEYEDPTLWTHFGETLKQIALTCLQGCTHRLLADAIVLKRMKATKTKSDLDTDPTINEKTLG